MFKSNKIELGDEVVCKMTGFKGIASTRTIYLQGVRRFTVQPSIDKEGKIPNAYDIDETSLKIITKGKVEATKPDKIAGVKLGDEVIDSVTGFTGIITAEDLALNGCIRFAVQPKTTTNGKLRNAEGFDAGRLKVIVAQKVEEGQRRMGGPMEKSVKI